MEGSKSALSFRKVRYQIDGQTWKLLVGHFSLAPRFMSFPLKRKALSSIIFAQVDDHKAGRIVWESQTGTNHQETMLFFQLFIWVAWGSWFCRPYSLQKNGHPLWQSSIHSDARVQGSSLEWVTTLYEVLFFHPSSSHSQNKNGR